MSKLVFTLKFGKLVKEIMQRTGLDKETVTKYVEFFYVEKKRSMDELKKILKPYYKAWYPVNYAENDGVMDIEYVFQFPKKEMSIFATKRGLIKVAL